MTEQLRRQQFQLAAHLRDPEHNPPPPGIEERRLAIYRELFFNNVESLLSGSFPVLRQTLGANAWRELVRRFYARHRCHTPLFAEVAAEFVAFLQQQIAQPEIAQADNDPPWLAELAHYEWVELALQIDDSAVPTHHSLDSAHGDLGRRLLHAVPVWSPFAWPLAYRWPVPRIGPEHQPDTPPPAPTLLLVRRDRDHAIRFAELSPLVYRLIELLQTATLTGAQALQTLAVEAGTDDVPAFLEQGAAMLERMHAEGSILGVA